MSWQNKHHSSKSSQQTARIPGQALHRETYDIYNEVITNVIKNIKPLFYDENLDDEVIDVLRSLWIEKLNNSKVLAAPEMYVKPKVIKKLESESEYTNEILTSTVLPAQGYAAGVGGQAVGPRRGLPGPPRTAIGNGTPQNQAQSTGNLITQMSQKYSSQNANVNVGNSNLAMSQTNLSRVVIGRVPDNINTKTEGPNLLQSKINPQSLEHSSKKLRLNETQAQAHLQNRPINKGQNQSQPQTSQSQAHAQPVYHLDGHLDESDDDNSEDDLDDSTSSSSENEAENVLEPEESSESSESSGAKLPQEKELCSDDDLSNDGDNIFNCENQVLCQYEVVRRNKEKWTLKLLNGVMNIRDRDYIFNKINGEVEW